MSIRKRAEEALRQHQDKIGVLRGGPNLYPGTAARIVSDEWEQALRDVVVAWDEAVANNSLDAYVLMYAAIDRAKATLGET